MGEVAGAGPLDPKQPTGDFWLTTLKCKVEPKDGMLVVLAMNPVKHGTRFMTSITSMPSWGSILHVNVVSQDSPVGCSGSKGPAISYGLEPCAAVKRPPSTAQRVRSRLLLPCWRLLRQPANRLDTLQQPSLQVPAAGCPPLLPRTAGSVAYGNHRPLSSR